MIDKKIEKRWRKNGKWSWIFYNWNINIKIKDLQNVRANKTKSQVKSIDIIISLLRFQSISKIKKENNCWNDKILRIKKVFLKDQNWEFRKTKHKWRKTKYWNEVKEKIIETINTHKKEKKWCDMVKMISALWFENSLSSYNTVRYLTRRKRPLLYQKPYVIDKKRPADAETLLKKKYRGNNKE